MAEINRGVAHLGPKTRECNTCAKQPPCLASVIAGTIGLLCGSQPAACARRPRRPDLTGTSVYSHSFEFLNSLRELSRGGYGDCGPDRGRTPPMRRSARRSGRFTGGPPQETSLQEGVCWVSTRRCADVGFFTLRRTPSSAGRACRQAISYRSRVAAQSSFSV
jgi:hypothetical protein